MKKFLLVLVVLLLILPNAFGQDRKHTIYVDIFPMGNGILSGGAGLGIGYDYSMGKYFSIGGYANLFTNFKENITYNLVMVGKYYPIETNIGKPYIDLGLGYRRRQSEEDNIHCLAIVPHIGFKFIFPNGLVLDPAFGIRYNLSTFSGEENFKFGFNIKAIIGWMF